MLGLRAKNSELVTPLVLFQNSTSFLWVNTDLKAIRTFLNWYLILAVFKYAVGKHNVFKVSGPAFQACNVPPDNEALATGKDVITLMTPGRKWYVCGKAHGAHCQNGQKLVINVLPATEEAPAPYLSLPPAWEPAKAPSYSTPPVWQAPTPAGSPYSGPTEHIVGDEKGWTLNFNYTAWAEGRQFRVGDTLGTLTINQASLASYQFMTYLSNLNGKCNIWSCSIQVCLWGSQRLQG